MNTFTIARRIKHAFRGQVGARAAVFEIGRRGCMALRGRYERIAQPYERAGHGPARLIREFAKLPPSELLEHFRTRSTPRFFAGFDVAPENQSDLQRKEFPAATSALLNGARNIVNNHRWPLLGYGELGFGREIEWLREPVSGVNWPRDFYADVSLTPAGSADVRVLWELNRLAHLLTLGRAYAVTGDESFAEEFFVQVESWRAQNRIGFGPNWSCAMEVALRAMNLLTALQLFRGSSKLTEERLQMMLTLFEEHGGYIRHHLEFSYIATSNHYLSDVVGLFWLGVCLPELEQAAEWRMYGFREMLREMDKQILPDGAHYEASTGYHRFVLELFLYSFILCRANSIEIADRYWQKLRSMLEYLRSYLRPDGKAPLIGDTDSGQVMPMDSHTATDHNYLLGIAAVILNEPNFKISEKPPQEIAWLLGEEALERFRGLGIAGSVAAKSAGFPEAGTFILRDRNSYLLLNASGTGLGGRGAHGHNDALSLEVAACGTSFISDPGTYVYSSDLALRHQFRSTGFHSTVEVDGREQNTTDESAPFRLGNQARPHVSRWESCDLRDLVIGEHYGYKSLPNGPVIHTRAVLFEKSERYWQIDDALIGSGRHTFRFCFHVPPGLEVLPKEDGLTEIRNNLNGSSLLIVAVDLNVQPVLESRWFSRDYGAKSPSVALCWKLEAEAPLLVSWLLVPSCADDEGNKRLELIQRFLTSAAIGNRQFGNPRI